MAGDEERQVVDGYTLDGTADLKGNPIQRSKRGGWRACSFVLVYEVFERMAYYGISTNLVLYLTNKLHQGTVASANNVTNWVGTVWMTPILGAYIADAHLGRYWTFLAASAVYISGMCLLTLAVSVPSLKPPPCANPSPAHCEKASTLQLAIFYGSLYILALGTGGTKPNISTIGADQFDDFDVKEKQQKLSFFNWWMFGIFFGTLFANTALVYIQDNVGWTLGYALPTLGLAISIGIFIAGTPFYRHRLPSGSPFTTMARVIVAALHKSRLPSPREVEETKQMTRMIPILVATFIPSTMAAQTATLFVKQGTTLRRSLGSFSIPPASLGAFITISMLISVVIYDRIAVKLLRRWTKNPRGITLLQRMGIGIFIHVLIMVIASLTENYRLKIAKLHDLDKNNGEVPLSIFVLVPQFILFGLADAFLAVAQIEFFYDQAPENMKSLGTSYATTSLGVGNFISSFLLKTVSDVTMTRGKGWILNDLNASRLDLYYALLAVLSFINFVFFLLVAKRYIYKPELSDAMRVLGEELKGMAKANIQK